MRYECCGCDVNMTQAVEKAFGEQLVVVTAAQDMGDVDSVVLVCPNGHHCRYRRATESEMADASAVVKGESVSQDQVQRIEALKDAYSPTQSLKLLDDFSKFLFGATATVAALGTALGVNGFGDLEGSGRTLFSFAVLSLAFSLFAATAALLPLGMKINPNSPESASAAFASAIRLRLGLVTVAAVFFATALGLAGFAPLASSKEKESNANAPTAISYRLTGNGALTVVAHVANAVTRTPVSLKLIPRPAAPRRIKTAQLTTTDSKGRVDLQLGTKRTKGVRKMRIALTYQDKAQGRITKQTTVSIRRRVRAGG